MSKDTYEELRKYLGKQKDLSIISMMAKGMYITMRERYDTEGCCLIGFKREINPDPFITP
jgi:hypothetical protein